MTKQYFAVFGRF